MTPRKTHQRNVPATLSIAARVSSRVRIPRVLVHHPVLRGERNFLRDLRAAEMAAWEAGLSLKDYQQVTRTLQKLSTGRDFV